MKKKLVMSALMIMGLTGIQKLIAFLRETVFAAYYGTTMQSDAYFVANNIPVVLFAIIGVAITTTILPIYTNILHNKTEEDRDYFISNIINIMLVLSIGFSVFGVIFSSFISKMFAPSFSAEAIALTTKMTQIMFPSVIFTSLMSLSTVVLNAKKIFLPAAAACIAPPIIVIIGTIISGK